MANENFEDIWKIMKEIKFVTKYEITNDLICNICNKLMIKASQAQCGCRYCSLCIESYLGSGCKFCPGKKSKYCQNKMINFAKDIKIDHVANVRISEIIVKCPRRNCEFLDELSAIESHMRTCDKNPINCPYFKFGCNKSEVLSNEMQDHLYNDSFQHNELLINIINNLSNEIESMRNGMNELKTENQFSHDLTMGMEDLSRNETANKLKIENLNQRIDSLTNENISLKVEIERICQSISDIKQSMDRSSDLIREVDSSSKKCPIRGDEVKFESVDNLITELDDSTKNCPIRGAEVNFESVDNLITELDDSTKNCPIRGDEVKFESFDNLWSATPIMSLNIVEESELESESFFGEFNWKIDKLSQQPVNSWRYSGPFYSHRFGYKMCLSVNFSSNAVNVYFHLLRGENDDQLAWPFKYGVTIGAIDQLGGSIYSSRTVKYDFCPNNKAWIKPITERNSEIWCFTFLGVTLKNDKLRFKCKVDF